MAEAYQGPPTEVLSVVEEARRTWPGKSDAWLAVWLRRMAWYVDHDGNMVGAPEFPSE